MGDFRHFAHWLRCFRGGVIQLQHDYGSRSLAEIAVAGLDVYGMVPDFQLKCPVCGGSRCAVRHGVYRRRVVDHGTIYEDFPVPRFRCRSRGPMEPSAATFSVLPDQLLPRKQPSLPLVVWMLHRFLVSYISLSTMLDELAESFKHHSEPWLPEVSTVYRLMRLFALARKRVDRLPPQDLSCEIPGLEIPVGEATGLVKHHALEMLGLLAGGRGSPIVGHYHRAHFPLLLFGPPRQPRRS